jgi:hypothetical protein
MLPSITTFETLSCLKRVGLATNLNLAKIKIDLVYVQTATEFLRQGNTT